MSEHWFYKLKRTLVPTDEAGQEAIAHLSEGECVQVTIRKVRNPAHHRKFFALLQLVYDNQETYPTIEHLLTAVKVASGWYHEAPVTVDGMLVYLPKSIAFHRMDQVEFDRFYMQAIVAICRLLPQFDKGKLQEAVLEFAA